ncbi:MAG: AAA family ATPase [Longimicrobiales bacterium]
MDDIRQIPSGHLYVISGCSGSGKSTLIAELAQRGEVVVPEPGRRVVQAQDKAGGPALPWGRPSAVCRPVHAAGITRLRSTCGE